MVRDKLVRETSEVCHLTASHKPYDARDPMTVKYPFIGRLGRTEDKKPNIDETERERERESKPSSRRQGGEREIAREWRKFGVA